MKVTHSMCSTGVLNNNGAEWLHEDSFDAIDLNWLEFTADSTPDEVEEMAEFWESQGPYLVGFKECEPRDPGAWYHVCGSNPNVDVWLGLDPEAEYSAIYHVNENTTQVVRSKWAQFCHGCSPCYPYQGDLDSPRDVYAKRDWRSFNNGIVGQGDGWAYTLPTEVWGEFIDDRKIVEVSDD